MDQDSTKHCRSVGYATCVSTAIVSRNNLLRFYYNEYQQVNCHRLPQTLTRSSHDIGHRDQTSRSDAGMRESFRHDADGTLGSAIIQRPRKRGRRRSLLSARVELRLSALDPCPSPSATLIVYVKLSDCQGSSAEREESGCKSRRRARRAGGEGEGAYRMSIPNA